MAIPDLAERAAVLPLHADRLRALLGKARVVEGIACIDVRSLSLNSASTYWLAASR